MIYTPFDPKSHVVDKTGKPIPGLFATGEVTGGVHGTDCLRLITTLLPTISQTSSGVTVQSPLTLHMPLLILITSTAPIYYLFLLDSHNSYLPVPLFIFLYHMTSYRLGTKGPTVSSPWSSEFQSLNQFSWSSSCARNYSFVTTCHKSPFLLQMASTLFISAALMSHCMAQIEQPQLIFWR